MKCLEYINLKADMYSVDLLEQCYRCSNKKSGFQLEELKKYLSNYDKHKMFLGKYAAEVLDEIGKDIDFLVLDTAHEMPGEVIEFLCFLPYLAEHAIVVLHDTMLNFHSYKERNSFATKILFNAVYGIKYDNVLEGIEHNIAAFEITKDTYTAIANVFYSLSITWNYLPEERAILACQEIFKKYYNCECNQLFDYVLMRWKKYFEEMGSAINDSGDEIFVDRERIRYICENTEKPIYLYGNGKIGRRLCDYLRKKGVSIGGYIVSDEVWPGEAVSDNVKVYKLSDISKVDEYIIFLATVNTEAALNLIYHNYDYIFFSDIFYKWLERNY